MQLALLLVALEFSVVSRCRRSHCVNLAQRARKGCGVQIRVAQLLTTLRLEPDYNGRKVFAGSCDVNVALIVPNFHLIEII